MFGDEVPTRLHLRHRGEAAEVRERDGNPPRPQPCRVTLHAVYSTESSHSGSRCRYDEHRGSRDLEVTEEVPTSVGLHEVEPDDDVEVRTLPPSSSNQERASSAGSTTELGRVVVIRSGEL